MKAHSRCPNALATLLRLGIESKLEIQTIPLLFKGA